MSKPRPATRPAEPGGRTPAPPPLRLLQLFGNTLDREAGVDALDTPPALSHWLHGQGLLTSESMADPTELRLAQELREGLRGLFLSHHAHAPGSAPDAAPHAWPDAVPDARRLLEASLARLPLRIVADGGTPHVTPIPTTPVMTALAHIAVVLVNVPEDELRRLKACHRDRCQWVFFDASKNRSGAWCSMAICGSKSKMATYRRRSPQG